MKKCTEDRQPIIDRYLRAMRFAFLLVTVIWLGLAVAVILFAADWVSALVMAGMLSVIYIWISIRYRQNVKQAVEEYRRRFE